jgi:hypothetical protein
MAERSEALVGPHLTNWICEIGRKRSHLIFDFAVLSRNIPIPERRWPPGQRLEGVKLHRARGGCLGAKSR